MPLLSLSEMSFFVVLRHVAVMDEVCSRCLLLSTLIVYKQVIPHAVCHTSLIMVQWRLTVTVFDVPGHDNNKLLCLVTPDQYRNADSIAFVAYYLHERC